LALATKSLPIAEFAPGLFSTIKALLQLLQLRRDQAREDVVGAARREADDEFHGPIRDRLARRLAAHGRPAGLRPR
jgi:hypothetical protein